jgi:hypothetical protein
MFSNNVGLCYTIYKLEIKHRYVIFVFIFSPVYDRTIWKCTDILWGWGESNSIDVRFITFGTRTRFAFLARVHKPDHSPTHSFIQKSLYSPLFPFPPIGTLTEQIHPFVHPCFQCRSYFRKNRKGEFQHAVCRGGVFYVNFSS